MGGGYNSHIAFCLLLCAVLSLWNLQITLVLCLILKFCMIEYLVQHKIFCLHGWPIVFPPHHMLFLSTVSQYNNLNKSKNHPSSFIFYLLYVNCFILRNSGPAKTWPTGPFATAWHIVILCNGKIFGFNLPY